MSPAAIPAENSPVALPRPKHVAPVALRQLAALCAGSLVGADVSISGITASSGRVRAGDLFAGVPGQSAHGAQYAAAAVAAGALAVLTDSAGRAAVPAGVPVLLVGEVRGVLGPVAAEIYGRPSHELPVLGVTGTSGKTTTTFLVRAGLQAAGRPSGLIGTIATLIGDEVVKTGFTTPEAPDIQALLAVMRECGATVVAAEVSSHALAMGRAEGIEFALGAFTNLSQDHLDFHADMAEYFAAKARLFDGRARSAVIVTDDEWGRRMAAIAAPGAVTVSTGGDRSATWQARDIAVTAEGGTTYRALGPGIEIATGCSLPGGYNVANALLALAILAEIGVAPEIAASAIAVASVPGRMERIDAGQPFLAVVDYSHKPAAVDGALRTLRPLTRCRLIIVLGSGGDRDRGKRAMMGEIAARGADLLIVTDDNPRSEDPAAIRQAMLDGALAVPAAERGELLEVGDRANAIAAAVERAAAGDTILVAGKGHEPGQEIAGVIHPFDDRTVLRQALS
ncbi:MAG: UDP-N-acetylmuramoyl-L-alanyl-D-glutamate--2,6-diaminopimelate ligase [Pseudonocardiales bacterium]|nr:MAG: UDP-N-acetylmuramoyl-L-alanyl-D-glutamate--2,6-diaminopimelate ligase [Pseudonocardiales bacterium]